MVACPHLCLFTGGCIYSYIHMYIEWSSPLKWKYLSKFHILSTSGWLYRSYVHPTQKVDSQPNYKCTKPTYPTYQCRYWTWLGPRIWGMKHLVGKSHVFRVQCHMALSDSRIPPTWCLWSSYLSNLKLAWKWAYPIFRHIHLSSLLIVFVISYDI